MLPCLGSPSSAAGVPSLSQQITCRCTSHLPGLPPPLSKTEERGGKEPVMTVCDLAGSLGGHIGFFPRERLISTRGKRTSAESPGSCRDTGLLSKVRIFYFKAQWWYSASDEAAVLRPQVLFSLSAETCWLA